MRRPREGRLADPLQKEAHEMAKRMKPVVENPEKAKEFRA